MANKIYVWFKEKKKTIWQNRKIEEVHKSVWPSNQFIAKRFLLAYSVRCECQATFTNTNAIYALIVHYEDLLNDKLFNSMIFLRHTAAK